ncbi:hypothetical protein D9758_011776 [Tetrapyrgos nigripes]|uniref:PROP1-like PPR domain-containing protein n=1 Tax=Tetrapyrgos nigripes TaxID=182062 RepID=A0A8H5CXT6_9AGAR|nr:hypothetical protein D9758_011776 [Tetrapyrgos nigripes]
MLPKVATTLLHSTSRAATAVGQSHTIRNVLQLQHSNSSTSSQQSSSSQSSTGGSGPNGPAGKGPGSNFFNPNWHGSPGTRDGTARGGRFAHGYLSASRAVAQAQPFASTSDGPSQLDESQDEFEIVVPKRSQANTTRRFRSHSLSYSPKERAQKLGVLRTVQLHARSKHVFVSPDRPDSVEASVGECVRPVSPTRLVRSRSNSTTSAHAPDPEGLQLQDAPPPPPPLSQLENSTTTHPSFPQSVVPPSQTPSESFSPAPASLEPSAPVVSNRWYDALLAARDSRDPEEMTRVLNAFRSATSLALEASTQTTSSASLSSPAPRSKADLPPGARIPIIAELNLALEVLHASRVSGEPLTDMLKVYADIMKFSQLLTDQGRHNEARLMKPNMRTYSVMINALCDREGEVASAFEVMANARKWRSWSAAPASPSIEENDDRHIRILKAENNFRSAVALFQAMTSSSSRVSGPDVFAVLFRACAVHCALATAAVPSSTGRRVPVWSPSEQEAMITEAVTSAIHIWGHLEQSNWRPTPTMYKNMLNTFGRPSTGKASPARGWEGVKDVWADFRTACTERRINCDTERSIQHSIMQVWNAMIEASFKCGQPGFGVTLLDEMMRVTSAAQDVSVSSASTANEESQQDQTQSGEKLAGVVNLKDVPLPGPSTFTTIIAGFVGLALKAINGVPTPEDVTEKVNTSQLQAARSALEQYKEHMGTALVWMDKLASMPVGPAEASSSSTPVITRPEVHAWRTVLEALNEGYHFEMDWSEKGLEIGDSATVTFSLPALQKNYDALAQTIASHPEDNLYLRRLDTRMLFNSNLRQIYALKGRLNWAIAKGEEVLGSADGHIDSDKLSSIQATVSQARKDLFDALEKQERRLLDIPTLEAILSGVSLVKPGSKADSLNALDIDMVKRVWESWGELSKLKGSWESADAASEDALLLSQARARGIDIAITFFTSPSATQVAHTTRSSIFKAIVWGFVQDVLNRSSPAPGCPPLSLNQAIRLDVSLAQFKVRKELGLRMDIAVGVAFTQAMNDSPEQIKYLNAAHWRSIVGRFAEIEIAPKSLVEELLPPTSGIKLPDILAVVRCIQENCPDYHPMAMMPKARGLLLSALCLNRDFRDVEAALSEVQGPDNVWVEALRTMHVQETPEDGVPPEHSSQTYTSAPLPSEEPIAKSLGGLNGDELSKEILNDGMSVTTEASGSGASGTSIGQSTAPSSPVVSQVGAEQEAHMQAAQIESGTPALDTYQLAGQNETFLGGRPVPNHLYVDRSHSRTLEGILGRALGQSNPAPFVANIFDQFIRGVITSRVPNPYTFSRILQLLGRARQFDKIQFVYRVAQSLLAMMEQDKKLQSDSWFMIEDGMILAFAQAGEVDAAHVHRMRILEQGGTPSADAYGGLILHVKDTTDDTSNAMALYQEAVTRGVVPNAYLYNNIISKLAKARKADYALELFHQMRSSGIKTTSITFGAVIGACARVGDVDSAELLFGEMAAMKNFKPRVPPFNTMMQLYTTTKPNRERALHYYQLMRSHGVSPTEYTYKLLMEAYVLEPIDITKMEEVFQELISNPRLQVQGSHFATLINAYGCVAKNLEKATSVFDSIPEPQLDALVFEAMTNVLVAHRRMDLIPVYMAKMTAAGVHMTAYIMNLVIKGHSTVGDIEKARELFESLSDPPEGMAAINNHAPHDPKITMSVDPMAPVYREPSTWEAMVRAELGAGHRDRAIALLERLRARQYPEAVFNRISGILVDHSQIFP